MSTTKSVSQAPKHSRPTCGEYNSFWEGIEKGYADCGAWCREKCTQQNLSPDQKNQMIRECRQESVGLINLEVQPTRCNP